MEPSPLLSRRTLLRGTGAALLLGSGLVDVHDAPALAKTRHNPFTLGVASGDPRHDSVVLWTRLAPDPFDPDGHGGMSTTPVKVEWQVAADPRFHRVVRQGTALADVALAHSVHPEVWGLQPDRVYWYRFRVGSQLSPIGRTRTFPAPGTSPRDLRLAFASCPRWHDGFFTAYDHLAKEDLDFVLHLGDYIYETEIKHNARHARLSSLMRKEAVSLRKYRLRYALYKSDASLQRAHAHFPWIHTIDDHEVENDWAADISQPDHEPDRDPAVFRSRRARAYRAMYEHMPLRHAQLPRGSHVRLHRRLAYGDLADLTLLDTRQYRSNQPCEGMYSDQCDARFDPDQTMLGGKQKAWLLDGWAASTARWQLLGNQAPMAQTDTSAEPDRTRVYLDPWDGYVAERNEVLGEARRRQVRNLVVLTGDRHANHVFDLRADYQRPDSALVGTEFVGTSITSDGDGADLPAEGREFLAANPHLRFYNGQRGYVRMHIDQRAARADFRVIPYVRRRSAPVRTRASYVVESGRLGVHAD